MIIFGWGRQTIKQIGAVFKTLCNHCHNEEYWILARITTWFTLFFIPIIPYSTKYFLSCPVCKYGVTLNDQQIGEIKPIAEINQLLVDGQITPAEYQVRMAQLNNSSSKQVETKPTELKALNTESQNLSHCSGCGTQFTKEVKFCRNCGMKVNKSGLTL